MAKVLKQSWLTLWDKNGDNIIDEVDASWIIGTTDDVNLIRQGGRSYTIQTTYLNPAGDLNSLTGTITISQLITAIKTNIKSAENII